MSNIAVVCLNNNDFNQWKINNFPTFNLNIITDSRRRFTIGEDVYFSICRVTDLI